MPTSVLNTRSSRPVAPCAIRFNTDETLVQACKENDPTAWDQFSQRFRQRIYRYVRRLGAKHEDAEDVTSQTFFRIIRGISQFRGAGALEPWVLRIAHNEFVDVVVRSNGGRRGVPAGNIRSFSVDTEWDLADNTAGPAEIAIEKDTLRSIFNAVDLLPPYQRHPFLRHYRDGRSYAEIADEEQVPMGTVRSRLNRARTELKRRLAV